MRQPFQPSFTRAIATCSLAVLLSCSLSCSSTPGPHALYSADPTSNQNPVPDARLLGDGGLTARANAYVPYMSGDAVSVGATDLQTYMGVLAQATAPLTGFGNFGGELVGFSVSMSASSLNSAFAYVALGSTPAAGPSARVFYNDSPPYARVEPSLPLAPASSYALVLTDSAQTGTGTALVRAPDFDTWAKGAGASQVSQIAQVLGVAATHIVFAMVFPTQDARADVEALASWVGQSLPAFAPGSGLSIPSPNFTDCQGVDAGTQCPQGIFSLDAGTLSPIEPWFVANPFDGGPGGGFEDPPVDVGMVVAGTVTLKDARDSEDGHFQPSVVQNPSTGRDVDRAFVLVLPNPQTVPMPPNGYPLVLVGHGLGQRNSLASTYDPVTNAPTPVFSMCVEFAEFFAQAGYGCVGIDAPSHGTRGAELQFFRFDDLTITRDYFREMAFDQMQIMRIAGSGLLSQFGPTIDPNNLRYFGISLGGIMGSTFLSVDPRSLGGVLNVPGGGLTHIFESPNIFQDLGILLQSDLGILFYQADGGVSANFQATTPYLITLVQAVLESGDPINYAAALPPAKHILIQEGLLDQTVPNDTNDDLTAAFGVSTLTAAASSDGGIDGRWQFDVTKWGLVPGTGTNQVDPHDCFALLPEVRQQAGDYLQSDDTEIIAE